MSYLPELHYCCVCGEDLGAENGDGICRGCDEDEEDYPGADSFYDEEVEP